MSSQNKPLMKLGKHNQVSKALAAIQQPSLPTKKLQMNIPEELHKKFKLTCLTQEIDMTGVVIELIKNWLDEQNKDVI
ncbi:plasmid partition protein ParG [Xenorhabdus ishibashii]|uniref:ParG n=1 Tax=Xenorhabdus ishibashii TaxID=1034471 RepID=A0A2D0K808_9GAMM|nr:plasmid partition protein ParG [Xenorhabdus ishibashii]PHM59513.1 hypothetical protein Xish_03631 [Xenorhabdus ishibashii]